MISSIIFIKIKSSLCSENMLFYLTINHTSFQKYLLSYNTDPIQKKFSSVRYNICTKFFLQKSLNFYVNNDVFRVSDDMIISTFASAVFTVEHVQFRRQEITSSNEEKLNG